MSAKKIEVAKRATDVLRLLKREYPVAICELTHNSAFQLLAATILSAQCTDVRVNMVTPALFDAYPTPERLAVADVAHVEQLVRSTGFYQTKAKNLIGMASQVMSRFGGEVPREIEDLVTLPGVGRKTANVLRSVVFGLPGLPVDTHVGRLSRRLGLTKLEDPVKVEYELNAMLPPPEWGEFSLRLILHGRRVCDARTPRCEECLLESLCPSSMLPTKMPGDKTAAKKPASKPAKAAAKKSAKKPVGKKRKAKKRVAKKTKVRKK
jgi:endonuclease III